MLDLKTEEKFFSKGFKLIGAIDEAGRGPLAGPVVAACVAVEPGLVIDKELETVKDSKKLSAKKREYLYGVILKKFSNVGVGICDQETIDQINILEATFLAMKKAIGALRVKPEIILLDGHLPISNLSLPQETIVKGDELVFSIAAASIVAKVARDKIMLQMHEKYPQYGFDRHKGYGTKLHLEQLQVCGPCPIHRRSFAPVKRLLNT